MELPVKFEDVEEKIIELREQNVILDSDVAKLYGVETRDINKAVKNNPDKFLAGYIIELTKEEKNQLVENFHRFNKLKHSTVKPKAFTEDESETTIELNFAVLKFKHTTKKKKK